eukprot:15445155-Alexandrium_andersonii.AAC.1
MLPCEDTLPAHHPASQTSHRHPEPDPPGHSPSRETGNNQGRQGREHAAASPAIQAKDKAGTTQNC